MISREKIALIHVAKTRLQLDEDDYRSLLRAEGGVDSSRDLDEAGFERLLKRFQKLGFVSTSDARKPKTNARRLPSDPITAEQRWRIEQNYIALGFDTARRQTGFNIRQCGRGWPQTVRHGQQIIQGQESMLARMKKETS